MKPKPRSLADPLNGSRCHLSLHGPGTWNARQRILWRFYEPTYLRAAPEGAACLTAAGRARLVLVAGLGVVGDPRPLLEGSDPLGRRCPCSGRRRPLSRRLG